MESSEKKLKIPPAGVHDVRYLYTIIDGLKRRGGKIDNNHNAMEYLRRLINSYNDSKATSFGLSYKPREVNTVIVEDAVNELLVLGMIQKEGGHFSLTDLGGHVFTLIEKRESRALRHIFAKAMLDNYSIFGYFLQRLRAISDSEGCLIPEVTS